MKKITLIAFCLFIALSNVVAQQKKTTIKKNNSTQTPASKQTETKKETVASSEAPSQNGSAGTESKKEEKNMGLLSANATVDEPGNERESMPYLEVYTMYKEKVDRIENDFLTKKAGIQKNTTLSKEDIQKKIDEYNAYRVQLLTDLFGQKNFIEYESNKKH